MENKKYKVIALIKIETAIKEIIDKVLFVNENGLLSYNELEKDRLYDLVFARLSMDIDFSEDDYKDYDLLVSEEIIYDFENNKQYCKYKNILDKMLQHKIEIANSTSNILIQELDKANDTFQTVVDALTRMIDKGDPNIIAKNLSKGIELIANQLAMFDVKSKIEDLVNKHGK